MSKTTDSLRRASASRDAQTTAVEAQARVDAQNLILNENKRLAEINSEQAEALRVSQLAQLVKQGGDLSPSQVAELQQANTPAAVKTLKRSGNYHDPASDLSKGAAIAAVGAVGIAAFGPIAVPVLGASKVLERVFSPKN